jgi:hypothetical protein
MAIHPHTDMWMHRESKYRQKARVWLQRVLNTFPAAEPSKTSGPALVLDGSKLQKYVEQFNADDEELYANIPNKDRRKIEIMTYALVE